jgi:hypothetical protein
METKVRDFWNWNEGSVTLKTRMFAGMFGGELECRANNRSCQNVVLAG